MAINLEGNFQAAPGVFQTEIHMVGGRADGLEQIRLLSGSMRRDTGHAELALTDDVVAIFDAADGALGWRFRGTDSGSKALENFVDVFNLQKPDTNSVAQIYNAAGGLTNVDQVLAGVGMARNTFGAPAVYYANTGGAASQLFRTGVTMGGTGDKAAGTSNLTLAADAGQTAPLLDMSSAGAIALMKMAKTAIVPAGALVRFKVQDETGGVFYLTAQAA
jgi:hypothetical protein